MVERGLCQGCNLSPDLFPRYANRIMKVVKELHGIHIGGININNILYADDMTLIADSEAKLQNLLNAVVMESEQNVVCPSTGKNRSVWLYQNH